MRKKLDHSGLLWEEQDVGGRKNFSSLTQKNVSIGLVEDEQPRRSIICLMVRATQSTG